MARIDAGRAAQVGGFVFRYLWARHRCMGADAPPTPRRLAILVAQGAREFDGINVEPYKDTPITCDAKKSGFLARNCPSRRQGDAGIGVFGRMARLCPPRRPNSKRVEATVSCRGDRLPAGWRLGSRCCGVAIGEGGFVLGGGRA